MAAKSEPTAAVGVEELSALEASVLKALCLTINTAGSELKYKILDTLSDGDFYFPVHRSVFRTLSELHRRGDYVISANLDEELQKSGEHVPANFVIDELFGGTLPGLSDLSDWVMRVRERARSGLDPKEESRMELAARDDASPELAKETQIASVSDVKKRLAEEHKRQSTPEVADRKDEPPPPLKSMDAASTSQVFRTIAIPPPTANETAQDKSASAEPPAAPAPPALPALKAAPTPPALKAAPAPPALKAAPAPPASKAAPAPPAPKAAAAPPAPKAAAAPPAPKAAAADTVLSSEADDWDSYMDGLAPSEGHRFETGFAQLDKGLGGVKPGLMLLMDDDSQRLANFMKQVTDQFASASSLRCLYFANELPKAGLRLRTLARLAAVPISDLERGRLKKDSPEWQRLDAEGRQAADWLKRVFVYEVDGDLDLALAGELVEKLLADSGDDSCMVVIDSIDKVMRGGRSSQGVVSQLKTLADTLDLLILAATNDPTLLASRDVDLAAIFRGSEGVVELEVLKAENDDSTSVTFDYEPDYCRFTER